MRKSLFAKWVLLLALCVSLFTPVLALADHDWFDGDDYYEEYGYVEYSWWEEIWYYPAYVVEYIPRLAVGGCGGVDIEIDD